MPGRTTPPRKFEGIEALEAILADPEARVWVDVTAAANVPVDAVTRLLDLHPLIAADIAERNQRARVTEVEGAIHVVLFWVAYEGSVTELEIDLVLEKRALLTVHEPGWDPFALQQLRGDAAGAPQARAGLRAVRDHRRDRRRATSPCWTRSRTRSTASRTP